MKFFFKLIAIAILLVAEWAPAVESMPNSGLGKSGRVIVGFKRQKVLLQEGKSSDEIAQIRAVETSSIVATLAKVRDEGYPEIKTEVVRESKGDGGFQVFEVGVGSEDAVVKALTEGDNEGLFAFVSPDYIMRVSESEPNDPRLNEQYMVEMIDLEEAWAITTGSSAITIGVCDTGIQSDHPDLKDHMLEGYDAINGKWENEEGADVEDRHGHGTHVTGIAAATGNNGKGIAGVGWNFNHRSGKAFDDNGSGTLAGVADCMRKLCEKTDVKILNLSLEPFISAIGAAADYCVEEHNTLVVQAAGNKGSLLGRDPYQTNVIMVGSTDQSDVRSFFSNYGPFVDIWAPGSDILSTMIGSTYVSASGTSMACSVVSGLAALIMASGDENMTVEEVRMILESTTTTDLDEGSNYGGKHGRVNAKDAVIAASSGTAFPTTAPTQCVGFEYSVQIFTDEYPMDNSWDIEDTEGTIVCSRDYVDFAETLHTFPCCINEAGRNTYTFTIYDSYGDGICCEWGNGYVKMFDEENELVFETTFPDGSSGSVQFEVGSYPFDAVAVWMKTNMQLPPTVPETALYDYLDGTTDPSLSGEQSLKVDCGGSNERKKRSCTISGFGSDDVADALFDLSTPEAEAIFESKLIAAAADEGLDTSNLQLKKVRVTPITDSPTHSPTSTPTDSPTHSPTSTPTDSPTHSPTSTPTDSPTHLPTSTPTDSPTSTPTDSPTHSPTDSPTHSPTSTPTDSPTHSPTSTPTNSPSHSPTKWQKSEKKKSEKRRK